MPRAAYVEQDAWLQDVWAKLCAHQGQTFTTAKGLPFSYTVRGGELFVDRRSKSITIATVGAALRSIAQKMAAGEEITGPKKIGCYGASYLYPIFVELGVLPPPARQMTLEELT